MMKVQLGKTDRLNDFNFNFCKVVTINEPLRSQDSLITVQAELFYHLTQYTMKF